MRVFSFHSVKGGAGKSTLATHTAIFLARTDPDAEVWLLDMDLTGTSLADALPLVAPCWEDGSLQLEKTPQGHDPDEATTRKRMKQREREGTVKKPCVGVPFFNDWLLYAPVDRYGAAEPPVEAVAWKLADGELPNLRVIPSSALPNDLLTISPVVADEEHSAFLESRLEYFLDVLLSRQGAQDKLWLVIDTPSTLLGVSRTVLSLALRLGLPRGRRIPLATRDLYMPQRIEALMELTWRACMATTGSTEDVRGLSRWLTRVGPGDAEFLRVVAIDAPTWRGQLRQLECLEEEENHPLLKNHVAFRHISGFDRSFLEADPEIQETMRYFLRYLG